MNPNSIENPFTGRIAEEYKILEKICPAAAHLSQRIGKFVNAWEPGTESEILKILEIGCGTGVTTLALLHSRPDLRITGVDISPVMLEQARRNLAPALAENRLCLLENDALFCLRETPAETFDIVASGYTLHNFPNDYRGQVLREILRVLKPGGVLVNGDRYALDNTVEHLKVIQAEVRDYFKVLMEMNLPDLLEQWMVHLFSDESPDRVMRMTEALDLMGKIGYQSVTVHFRNGVNALVSGVKPWP
jgi:tRNA (cmo5U34)-methyltransferase